MQGIIILYYMTSPNSSENGKESQEVIKKNKAWDALWLIKTWVEWVLSFGWKITNPKKYNLYKQDNLIWDVRQEMLLARNDNSDFLGISEDSIRGTNTSGNISDSDILTEIARFILPLKQARQKINNAIKKRYVQLGWNEAVLLETAILELDENKIQEIYSSPSNLKRFVKSILKTEPQSKRLQDIFDIAFIQNKDPDLAVRLTQAIERYEQFGSIPSPVFFERLLEVYPDVKKKKEICEFFDITLSLSDALLYWLISETDIKEKTKELYVDIWDNIKDEKLKDKLVASVRKAGIEISIRDISSDSWEKYINTSRSMKLLGEGIYTTLEVISTRSDNKSVLSQVEIDEQWNIHDSWIEKMGQKYASKIRNFSLWKADMVFVFRDINNETQYFKLKKTDISVWSAIVPGMQITSLSGIKLWSIGIEHGSSDISYEDFESVIEKWVKSWEVISEMNLRSKIATDQVNNPNIIEKWWALDIRWDERILDVSKIEAQDSKEALIEKIKELDPDGNKIGDGKIGPWLSFISKSWEEGDLGGREFVYTITELSDTEVALADHHGKISMSDFISAITVQGFKRISYMDPSNSEWDLLKWLSNFGVTAWTQIKGGELITEIEEEVDDGHGHHTKKKHPAKYEFFKSIDGWHIRMGNIKNNVVYFWEYESEESMDKVQKLAKAWKLSKKEEEWLYRWRTMSYPEFLHYVKTNKLKATTDNLVCPHAKHIHEPHEHFEWSFFSRMWKAWTISDIINGFHNLTHHIEHYFEKTSKLNASRFTLAIGKKLWLPKDLLAQAQSEEVASVKEIIEKLKDKLWNLNGPHGRTKALHIAHNRDARPEEVAAAMLYMVRGYGHLYAEDIAYEQWSYSFINWFLNACWFKTEEERKVMRQKAREKFQSDLGSEEWVEPTEEEMIWWFMKSMDGNWDQYPLAATVVKAMGGPSGWEKAWRTEGYEWAYEKGKRQWWDTVNADGRVNKWLSALITHEFNSVIGFMEKAAGKDPSPKYQAIPVVWALAGYSQYISTKTSQEVKKYSDGMWHTLHAYSFLRNYEWNKQYKAVFELALSEIGWQAEVDKMNKYINLLQRNNHHDEKDNDACKEAVLWLANIWTKYYDRWLHDHLQWKDTWLIEKVASGNKDAEKYLNTLDGVHQMNSDPKPPPNDNDWMVQYGYDGSPVLWKKEMQWKTVLSLERTLNKLHISTHSYDIDKEQKARLWNSVVRRMNEAKKISDSSLRKAQYAQYRRDILEWLRSAITTRGNEINTLDDLQKKLYYPDLLIMGIDPRIIVAKGETDTLIRNTDDEDYERWLTGGRAQSTGKQSVSRIIDDIVRKTEQRTWDYERSDVSRQVKQYVDVAVPTGHGANFDGWDSEWWDGWSD